MKKLKWILIALLLIILAALVAAYFMPRKIQFEIEKDFKAPPMFVYNVLHDVSMVEQWNAWKLKDESYEIVPGEVSVGQGATYSWTSDKFGSGKSIITKSTAPSRIEYELVAPGMKKVNEVHIIEKTKDGSKLRWQFETEIRWPSNLLNFMWGNGVKKGFLTGLDNLEALVAKRHEGNEYFGYEVKPIVAPQMNYLIRRGEVEQSKASNFYAQNLPSLFQQVQKGGLTMVGSASTLIFKWDKAQNRVDVAAALPVESAVSIGGVSSYELEGGRALSVDYYGDYTETGKAHKALKAYFADRNLIYNMPVVEEYVTDPAEEPNSEKWLTRIVYRVNE